MELTRYEWLLVAQALRHDVKEFKATADWVHYYPNIPFVVKGLKDRAEICLDLALRIEQQEKVAL